MSRKQRVKAQRKKILEAIRNLLVLEGFEVRNIKDSVGGRSRYRICTVHGGRIWVHMTLSSKHSLETVMMYLPFFKISRADIREGKKEYNGVRLPREITDYEPG